jgi:hypothetical protein
MGGWRALAPLLLTILIYTATAIGRSIVDADEGVYAHIPQQMLARGDWLTPYVNGVRSLDKPPLLYWLISICYGLFGVHEFTARIPAILSVVGVAWLVERLAMRSAGARAGMAAALAWAFCPGTFLFTLEVMHDILLVFFLTVAVFCFLHWVENASSLPYALGFFAALSGALLSKGLIGVAFPMGICALYLFISKECPAFRPAHLVLGSLLFLALALPWYIAMELHNPGFLRIHFLEEQILRFFARREPVDYQSVPLLLFWALVPVWLLPWSAFLPAVRFRKDRVTLLALCWAGLVLAFFSVSSRLEHYAFPLLPPLAILVGIALARDPPRRSFQFLAGLGVLLLVTGGVLAYVAIYGVELSGGSGLHPVKTYDNDFTIMSSFSPEILRRLLPPAIAVSIAMALCFLIAQRLAARGRADDAIAALTIAMAVFHAAAGYSIRVCDEIVSSKSLATALAREYRPGDKVVIWGDYETANSINFYTTAQLYVYQGSAPSLGAGLRYADAPRLLLPASGLQALWNSGERVFLIVEAARLPSMELQPVREVAYSAGRALLANRRKY